MSIKESYIQYGIPSNWAESYQSVNLPLTTFRITSTKNLIEKYNVPKSQIRLVKQCLLRQPIEDIVLNKLLTNSRFVCCLCKGQKSDAYIIHHIKEYSLTQDNSYNNLAVLCPNDHDLAHRTGISLTNRITETQIKHAKREWEKRVKLENSLLARKVLPKNFKRQNPFKELLSYSIEDRDFFFGRNQEINDLYDICNRNNLVGLFGESGTGKTSLINAGLLPKFQDNNFLAVSIRCFEDPIRRIREQVLNLVKKRIYENEFNLLISTDTFPRFINCLKNCLFENKLSILIVVDQFEELFTRASKIESEQFAKGIVEAFTSMNSGKLTFLFSLREDYIGELWDWTHNYNLVDVWLHQYRIKRFTAERAIEIFAGPIEKQGIIVDYKFIHSSISELQQLGDGLIYPPYLQIVCFKIFEFFETLNSNQFDQRVFTELGKVETIIASYLNETMLYGLTEDEKKYAEDILELLTSSEGLRQLLNMEDISRYTSINEQAAKLVVEHLIKRKIIHPIVDNDIVIGYELVHDFLSRAFFEKLDPETKRTKSIIEIFQKAFREWKQHNVLASKDRLEILYQSLTQINPNYDEWTFLLKSSFSVYYLWENKWSRIIDIEIGVNICKSLLKENDERIVESAISFLGKNDIKNSKKTLIGIFCDDKRTTRVRDVAISQFAYYTTDKKAIVPLRSIILNNSDYKLRKVAISALSNILYDLNEHDEETLDIIHSALDDNNAHVRKQAVDALCFRLDISKSATHLLARLEKEKSLLVRKAILSAFRYYYMDDYARVILPILEKIQNDPNEDYRVVEEAKSLLHFHREY